MFGRKRKAEGFEWHKYVRTTIKLRREERRHKMDRIRRSAAEGAKAAGDVAGAMAMEGAQQMASGARSAGQAAGAWAQRAAVHLAAGLRSAGSMTMAAAVWTAAAVRTLAAMIGRGLVAGATATGRGLRAAGRASGRAVMAVLRSDAMRPVLDVLGRPGVAAPLALAGIIALAAGIVRPLLGFGFNRETGFALLFGLACLAAAYGPRSLLGTAPPLPQWLAAINPVLRRRASYGCVALLVGVAAWSLAPKHLSLPASMQVTGSLPLIGGRTIEGRAAALTGDLLRLGPTVVKLAGIEVPEPQQRCLRPNNRRWRCAEAAHDALARLVRGRSIRCDLKGTDTAGRASGVCYAGRDDIAATLVKSGHAFAEQGFLARYASQEAEAQKARVGLWSGEAERPGTFRARAWEEAKRSAPDGCPIKGQVARGSRIYVLPWSPDYGRVRVSKARGGRWFCSEREAIAAGWERG